MKSEFGVGADEGRQSERADILAYLRHYLSCFPPFNEVPGVLRGLIADIEAGKHEGERLKRSKQTKRRRS